MTAPVESAVPDVLGPESRVVFCGINPGRCERGRASALREPAERLLAAAARGRLHAAPARAPGAPDLLALGIGLTNAARRTTRGSGDLRKADFAGAAERLEEIARTLRPEVDRLRRQGGVHRRFGERAEHGLQERRLGDTALFVLPSTSPANAAVSWDERLRWFRALRDLVA